MNSLGLASNIRLIINQGTPSPEHNPYPFFVSIFPFQLEEELNESSMNPHTSDPHAQTAREAWHIHEHKRLGLNSTDTIGLVVQGGGMRGVYSMDALAALEE